MSHLGPHTQVAGELAQRRQPITAAEQPCRDQAGGCEAVAPRARWIPRRMRMIRTAVLLGVAKKAYDVASKPENQRRIKDSVARLQARRAQRAGNHSR